MLNSKAYKFSHELVRTFLDKRVSRSAAQLSYFLTLTIFPTLIVLYTLIGRFLPTEEILNTLLMDIIPAESMSIITGYIDYIKEFSDEAMLYGGIALMATSSSAAFRGLRDIMSDIYSSKKGKGFVHFMRSFIFSFLFLIALYCAVIMFMTGEWFIGLVDTYIQIPIPWSWLRFIMLFAILMLMMMGTYRVTSPPDCRDKILIGAVCASGTMVLVGMVFSAFMSISARYSVVYGSLASFVILMLWLYIFSNILIAGNIINYLIRKNLS